jgi:MerR family transcriptional regulator, light-induced transcriptional regulator
LYCLKQINPFITLFFPRKISFILIISIQYIHKQMSNTLSPPTSLYRIGAVSKLSGVPVPTLRVWQTRYKAFSPATSQGQHRLYNEADLRKAALLKSLTGQGHGIRLIAGLSHTQLQQLVQTGTDMARTPAHNTPPDPGHQGSWAVVGQALAARLRAKHFQGTPAGAGASIQHVWDDLTAASHSRLTQSPDVLMVSVNALNGSSAQQILALSTQHSPRHTVVLYGFAQTQAMGKLNRAGCLVHREPLSDAGLAEIVLSTRPALLAPAWNWPTSNASVAPRQFSDAVLQRVANIPSQVLCECPRHVAELIGQLCRFEDYSLDCLQNSPKDTELHTQLNRVAATARVLLEQALQMVADHEGISLQDSA